MTTPTTVSVRLQLRADTAANWTSANPTLLANELGRETDTGKIKIGDGSTAWSSLAYQAWATLPIAVASGGTGQTSYTNGQLLIGNTTGNTLTKATLTAGSGIAITNGTGSITVAASGISDAQIAADAEIAVSKLADGAARQLLQTDAAGTGVEWASNIDIPGTLDVTSAATFDSTIGASAGTASLPSITFTGDLNTGIYSPGADQVAISTNGTNRFQIDSSGNITVDTNTFYVDAANNRVGVGTTSPGAPLDVVGSADTVVLSSNATNSTTKEAKIQCRHYTNAEENLMLLYGFSTSTDNAIVLGGGSGNQNAATTVRFFTAADTTTISGTEAARIDSSGRLLVGTSTPVNTAGSGLLQVVGGDTARPVIHRNINDQYPPIIYFSKARGTGNQSVSNGDSVGFISFLGYDGSNGIQAANIECLVDGTPGTNDMPGRIVLSTTADGASSPTERMRITSDGSISTKTSPTSLSAVGTTIFGASSVAPNAVNITRSSGYVLAINRTTDDGNLVEFYQDTTIEGTISVSGTTVSYNGAHLSRWSQLPSGQEREEILRGTILSNIDEMCEWGEEENEQLNRMKVSDVEGDKNVSGVFQAWDDDDDTYTNDFYCAMTGDFIIRIAAGVTVERGDLLMSAGDGTAKPQDDDIIRSKTVAKVTSTNVSCTYEDGSYCVPCVLMAC